MKNSFQVKDEYINSRLDRWFRRNISNVPQSFIEKNIRKGKIKVNNTKQKSSYKLKKNDYVIILNLNIEESKNKKNIKKYIASKKDLNSSSDFFIENNENFAVINKPAGIAVQSGTKSLKNILDILSHTKEFENFSPFAVHRLDKETTGVFIVAKNRKYAQLFTTLFRIRKIYKTYLGIVIGDIEKKNGTFVDDLVYFEGNKKIITKAITKFSVLDRKKNFSLLKLNPITGRKHQLRKQLLMHGYPILGDSKYRITKEYSHKKNSLMLHAHEIKFSINGIKYKYIAEPPETFKKILKEKYLKIF